jgi:hypothetical protein
MTRLLLLLFPSGWRARYGEELTDLVEQTGASPRVVFDIARAGLAERARLARSALSGGTSMTFGPAWRHPTAWAVAGAVVLLPTTVFVALSILTYQFSVSGLAGFADPLNSWLNNQRLLDLALVVAPALAALLAALPLVRIGYTHLEGGSEASLSVRLRALNVIVVVIGLGVACLLVGHILFESVMHIGP